MKSLIQFLLIACCVLGPVQATPVSCADNTRSVNIASTFTQVEQKILFGTIKTRVDLDIGRLTLIDGFLEGTYRVKIDEDTVPAPFRFDAKSKNEMGQISLPFNDSFTEFSTTGGILKGQGYCIEKDKSRDITCEVIPDADSTETGTIKLTINTGDRIMDFVSEYSVVGE